MNSAIPGRFTKVDKIDYPFVEQRLPFLLDRNFGTNNIEDINRFLQDDDELIRYYLDRSDYPNACSHISEIVEKEMTKRGFSVARVNGTVYPKRGYDPEFPFTYITNAVLIFKNLFF